MGIFFKRATKAYNAQKNFGEMLRQEQLIKDASELDTRYNEPKGKHKASEAEIDEAIEMNEIYKRAKELILKAQRGQIGYGLDKYPETLNADTWSMIETMHHIIDESVDKLHYEVMLLVKLERQAERELEEYLEEFKENVMYHDGININELGKIDPELIKAQMLEAARELNRKGGF